MNITNLGWGLANVPSFRVLVSFQFSVPSFLFLYPCSGFEICQNHPFETSLLRTPQDRCNVWHIVEQEKKCCDITVRLSIASDRDLILRIPSENSALSAEFPCDLTPAKENRCDWDLRFGCAQDLWTWRAFWKATEFSKLLLIIFFE